MTIGSPTAFLQWAILSCLFLIFLIIHLWNYDQFNCLRWDSGRQPGAFKRVMTYSYLGSVPLLVIFSVTITVLKFREGFVEVPFTSLIIPRPLELWEPGDKRLILPLYFVFSAAWSMEIVTHLEELAFWLFLLNQGQGARQWFESWEFKIWYLGSMAAILGVPITALVTRNNLETCIGYIFVVGSTASTITTILFLYVLGRFPSFLQSVKMGGAEPDVVVRLAVFYQLNLVRVVFRFLFTIPLLMIGLDGIQGSHIIIRNPFAADFLLMMGGIGCFVSSAITLLIFFPRSITKETGYMHHSPKAHVSDQPSATSTYMHTQPDFDPHHQPQYQFDPLPLPHPRPDPHLHYLRDHYHRDSKDSASFHIPMVDHPLHSQTVRTSLNTFRFPVATGGGKHPLDPDATTEYEGPEDARQRESLPREATVWDAHGTSTTYLNPHTQSHLRRTTTSVTPMQRPVEVVAPSTRLHPYVMTFVSPIDLPCESGEDLPPMS